MPHGLKVGNEYAAALGKFYADTPKAVFAALAFSYAAVFGTSAEGQDETTDPKEVIARLTTEWHVLQQNGIISQTAPTAKYAPTEEDLVKAGVLERDHGSNASFNRRRSCTE